MDSNNTIPADNAGQTPIISPEYTPKSQPEHAEPAKYREPKTGQTRTGVFLLLIIVAAAALIFGKMASSAVRPFDEAGFYLRYTLRADGGIRGIPEIFAEAVQTGAPTLLTLSALLFLSPTPLFVPAAAAVTAARSFAAGMLLPVYKSGAAPYFTAHMVCYALSTAAIVFFAVFARRAKQKPDAVREISYISSVAAGIPALLICAGICTAAELVLAFMIT